mgnify:FL=1
MTLMPMAGFVSNDVENVDLVATNDTTEGEFPALPDSKEALTENEYEPSDELIGMRDQTTKTYVLEDGKYAQLTHQSPVHYMADSGQWTDINTNVIATPNGWEVTENTFSSYFAPEVSLGVSVQVNEFVDPILVGIDPMVVTFDESGTLPSQYLTAPSNDEIAVGGNMIRYPVAEGFALDYTVDSEQLKQNLLVSERPILDESQAWFGFTERMILPEGYALFVGEEMIGEDVVITQESIDIRNIASGELLAEMPVPIVVEMDTTSEEPPYIATFIVQVIDGQIIISTVVESEWILSEDRVFPLAIDPTIKVNRGSGGYCYKYWNSCSVSSYGVTRTGRYSNTKEYMMFSRFTYTAANGMPTGATVDSITHHQYHNYRAGSRAANSVSATVLESCGSSYTYRSWTMPSAQSGGCSGALAPSRYSFTSYQSNSWNARWLINSLWNSAQYDTLTPSTGWTTTTVCNTASSCSSSAAATKILAAQSGATSIGIGYKVPGNPGYLNLQGYNSGSYNSYINIVYSGGTDTDAPLSGFVPYTGLTSYVEGSRTFFTSLSDMSGVDTTAANKPTLNYALNNGSFTSVGATSIGTCTSSSSTCRFKAVIPSISAGDYVEYYWKYQDLSATPNVGYDPALTGAQNTPTPYYFTVEDESDAGIDKKLTILTTDVYAGGSRTPPSTGYFDRQFTHFNISNEYYFEFDVSNCGSGSSGCFYTSNYYRYGNWVMQHATGAGTGYNGMASTNQRQHLERMHYSDGGYLTISATNGPGMNLLYHYDTGKKEFAMVGIGSAPSIDAPLTGGKALRNGYSGTYYSNWILDFGTGANAVDYGGMMGEFGFGNVSTSNTDANRLCIGSTGFTYFWRSPYSSRNSCSAYYNYVTSYGGSTTYVWSGWAHGVSYYGRASSSTSVTYATAYVKPMPDTVGPVIDHLDLGDSYSKTRIVSAVISDAGEPASGLNVSTTAGVGPTMYYRITPDGGAVGAWNATVMTQQSGKTRAQCILAECTWSADIEDLEKNDQIEYYITAQDVSTVSSGVNSASISNVNFSVGDPTTMFVVEWREMMYTTQAYTCTYQAVFYDVTNEIEFRYDNGCRNYRDAATVGFMDQTKAKGHTIRHSTSSQNLYGANPHTNNYRITTSATGDGSWEAFDRGTIPLVNADVSGIIGSSSGQPYGYYCSSSSFTRYAACADNIAMPNGFNFTYFGTDYSFTDSNDRIHLSRHGNMHFLDTGSTSTVRTMSTWGTNMPTLPGPSPATNFARAGMIAPYWSYYGTYYCYQSQTQDCGVYYRTMPFEGKGTDISSDITTDTTWDITDSPIRINPANDYLSISADLTIEPGTVIQVAPGKGISFDGACDKMTVNGNSTDHVRFEGQNGADWKGMAFTAACSSGTTDDRHVFTYVDFKNTSDAAIAAGSRHGASPVSNSNVGNFTMDHVTYENVGTAFSHGSGRGTVVSMNEFQVSSADNSCFDFAQDTDATLIEGTLTNCNMLGGSTAGAIVNLAGSTAGALHLENVTISNSYVNLISVDFASVTVSNVTATATSTQSGNVLNLDGGNGAEAYIYNLDAEGYTSAGIDATGVINMTDVDLGDASLELYPAGSASSSVASASGDNAIFDNVDAGDMKMRNIQPGLFNDVSVGDFKITGDPAVATDVVNFVGLNAEEVVMDDGCGWNARFDSMTADLFASVGCSASRSQIVIADSTIGHTSTTQSVFYALNSDITIGETAVTSTATLGTNNIYLAQVDTNSNIRLVEVTQDGDACADSSGATGDCDVDVASSSSEIWYGGLATVRTYRVALVSGSPTNIYKGDHTVTAAVVDSSELFEVGTHLTSSDTATLGAASVWVITGNEDDGDTFTDHNIRAFGSAGQNETLTSSSWYPTTGFTIGSTIDLLLQPAPVDFDAANMDCAWLDAYRDADTNAPLPTNGTTVDGKTIFEFDGTSITVSADLTLDGCMIILKGSNMKVKSTATSSPVVTLTNNGKILVSVSGDTGSVGAISAFSPAYGLNIDIVKGTLELDGGTLRDVAQDATTGAALLVGPDANFIMSNSAQVYGAAATSDSMATVKINGGSVSIADSSIINNGKTGTALWMQNTVGSVSNVIVKNAAVGIQSYNGAPQVDGFTATDNTVGLDVYGGMSLPIIYRSTLLSGQSAGWTTHAVDLSGFLSEDYLQVGMNSIFGGGNAHPRYNYWSTKYYMMTDRHQIELTDDQGNTWNITDGSHIGYYPYSAADPRSGDGVHATYAPGATGGIPSWDCNTRGYQYGPNYQSWLTGFFPYINQRFTGSYGSYPGYYEAPTVQFGFDWEDAGSDVTPQGGYAARYPTIDWGRSYNTYQALYNPDFYPPEGFKGSYNICMHYTSTYYMNSGQGARLTMPTIDLTASNLTKVTMYVDVLHNRADNYQDRLEIVARGGSNPADLGEYVRESGTPNFDNGVINGADTGVSVGGAFAAANFDGITINNPADAGFEISGQVASNANDITVNGGTYGVLIGNLASGNMGLTNLDIDGATTAGVYYTKDLSGDLSGTVTNAGSAFKFGQNTDEEIAFSDMTISGNTIGIDNDGSGDIILTDVTLSNTKDVRITGQGDVDVIDGTVDSTTVEVTGTGLYTRMRALEATITADGSPVADSTVSLISGTGTTTATAITNSTGVASSLTFPTVKVDKNGLTTPSINGYKAVTVAEVAYSYVSSSNNIADFRYASQLVTLADDVDNTVTVPLTTRIHERVCRSSSSNWVTVAPCAGGYFSTASSRQLSDGNGGTVTESGYFAGLAYSSRQNEILMLDTPEIFWKGNGGVFNMTGGTILATGAYKQYDSQRWLARYPYGTQMVLDDASVFGVTPNEDDGGMYGVHIGSYNWPITHFQANNTVFSNLASIEMQNGYTYGTSTYYWEMKEVSITNSTLSHFMAGNRGTLTGATAQTDKCIELGGGEDTLIHNNVFENCYVGITFERSTYYTRHGSKVGAWNATVSDNTFNDGGNQADIWFIGNGNSKNARIVNNVFNNAGSLSATSDNAAISAFPTTGNSGQTHKNVLISGNTINAANEGIYFNGAEDFRITDNVINGVGDAGYEGIHIVGGTGAVDNNTLTDTDGGLVVEEAVQPPASGNNLCYISGARYGYRYSASCTFTVTAGQPVDVNIKVDTWGYEASLEITKPGGAKDTWGRGTSFAFPSYRGTTVYEPIATYNATGTYSLTVRDSYGDGGIEVNVVEEVAADPYLGPVVKDNSLQSSDPNRIAPNAVGLIFDDCTDVVVQSARNTVSVSDNALSMSNCDVYDDSSSFVGDGTNSTVGINADDSNNDVLTLSGTTIDGFATGILKTSGDLALMDSADISGHDYGVYVDDVTVTAIDAAVGGGTTGTGLHVVDSDDVWVYPMNASGLVGMYVENTPFRWDGGTSTAVTSLQVVESEGSVENMTWPTTTTQINAGSNAYVTSIGNTIDNTKLTVAATATIDEANLFSLNSTHLEATPTKPVAMLIQSTDGSRASYVSTSFQPERMDVDGSNDDWVGGNALDPSGYAMPGKMSGDDTNDMLVTYIEGDYLYIGLTGEDLAASDVLIYLNVGGAGTTTGYNLGGAHTLPFMADYVLWADDASNFALFSHGFLGWGQTTSSSGATTQVASSTGLTEIAIPFAQIGGTPSEIDIVAIVQGETTADVSTVHPTQNIDSVNTLQTFTEYMTIELTKNDLQTGVIDDEVLVYRSYKGSNTASDAKNYDVMIKTKAACNHDWALVENISLATNVAFDDDYVTFTGDTTNIQDTIDIKRACPLIQPALDNITIDEDSGVYTFSLLNMADDEQDLESTLSWTSAERNLVSFDADVDGVDDDIVSWNQNVQQFTFTPLDDQFGSMIFDFEVTDSNGLKDSKSINLVINNVNDAPIICNNARASTDCMPVFTVDDIYTNINSEGFNNITKDLGSLANAANSYIVDQANEQVPDRQVYDWDASVDSSCVAFTVEVNSLNSLIVYENMSNEKGGTCTITMELTDDGTVNNTATAFTVDYSVAPVNDAPEISLQDANGQNLVVNDAGDRATGEGEFITMTEDDTNADNLTWDLLPLMSDIDHDVPSELTWTVTPTEQCAYTNYFTTAIVGTDLVFTLIPDATTNAKAWEQDFMNDNGIHQVRPNDQTFCAINLILQDTPLAPVHTPNYNPSVMPIANYSQGTDSVVMYVTIDNVAEKVADYSLDTISGVDFNGITNIMTGTEVPVSVNINVGGDEGPYTYDHMLAVTFFTDGHTDDQFTRTSYYNVPDYGDTLTVDEDVYITKDTTRVEVSMDVLTCLNNPCDLTVPSTERFQTDSPESHRANNGGTQGAAWSNPGQYGVNGTQTSERRPMLQDSYWCNNRLTTLSLEAAEASADWGKCNEYAAGQGSFGATNQTLPSVVRTIGASAVPSFAPSIVAVSLTGLFVSALAFSSRRADDEEEMLESTSIEEDEMAVSPVIATILMVAITVVLSGVIYVWASSLADTDVKGVPRVTFDIEDVNSFDADQGHWRITVQSSETDLATQAVEVRVFYVDASGEAQVVTVNLADTNDVYGFNPDNSESMVTFVDQVNSEGDDRVSTFNTGDTVFVRTHDSEGTPLEDVTITLNYAPNVGQGAQLRTWQGLSYDVSA